MLDTDLLGPPHLDLGGALANQILSFDPVIPNPMEIVVADVATFKVFDKKADVGHRGHQFDGLLQTRAKVEKFACETIGF